MSLADEGLRRIEEWRKRDDLARRRSWDSAIATLLIGHREPLLRLMREMLHEIEEQKQTIHTLTAINECLQRLLDESEPK